MSEGVPTGLGRVINITTSNIAIPFAVANAVNKVNSIQLNAICSKVGAAFGFLGVGALCLDAYDKLRDGRFTAEEQIDLGKKLISFGVWNLLTFALPGKGIVKEFLTPKAVAIFTVLGCVNMISDSGGGISLETKVEEFIRKAVNAYQKGDFTLMCRDKTAMHIQYAKQVTYDLLDINSPNSIHNIMPGDDLAQLEKKLYEVIEGAFYMEVEEQRTILGEVKNYMEQWGLVLPGVEKEIQIIERFPPDMSLNQRIVAAANESGRSPLASVYTKLYTYSIDVKEEADEEQDEKEDKDPRPLPADPSRRPRDPLIIDLNRDGKVSTTTGKRYFDLDANGLIEQVSWAAPGDGLLVLDRNGDGKITSGRELFGDQTLLADGTKATAGFQALAEFDSNGDGVIDARDEVFSQLRIWADIDGDGVFGENEFLTLEEAGIESIGLDFVTEQTTDENGNQIVRTGSVTWKDGDTSDISEFLLTNNMTKTVEYDKLDETDEIAKLPDLRGRGYLYSLHQAMLRDESGELASLVGNFADETNPADRRTLLNKMMMRWGAVSDSTIPNDGILGFLDKYYGRETEDPETISDEGWRKLERNYEAISVYLYGQMLAQTHFADIFDNLAFDWDESRNAPSLYISDALEEIAKGYIDNPELAKQTVSEFFLVLKTIALYKYVSEDELAVCAEMLATYSSELADVYNASYIAMQYNVGQFSLPTFGTDASESMDGRMLNEILAGLDGNDLIRGGAGADILIDGKGDDMLDGGTDSDIYIWNLGDGNDTIVNRAQSGEIDILRLGEGIHAENARITRVGSTILLTIGESGERIALSTGDSSDHNLQVAQVEFADGTVWSRDYMYSQKLEIEGTDGADAIDGSTGDDTITGGKGDDVLRGDSGSDTYVWNPGDGNDMIVDYRHGVWTGHRAPRRQRTWRRLRRGQCSGRRIIAITSFAILSTPKRRKREFPTKLGTS